jgi:hypothetical protein
VTRRANRRGATVIEALIAVFVGSMLIVVVLGLVNFSTKSFGRTQQRLDPREASSRIIGSVRRYLTDSKFYRIGQNGTLVKFITPKGAMQLTFDPLPGRIEVRSMQDPTARPAVIASGIRHFAVHQLRRGVLRVSLAVDRPTVYDGLQSLGPLAMVDEIHCIAAARQRMVPWNTQGEDRGPRRGGPRKGRGPRGPRGPGRGGPPPGNATVAD